MVKSVYSGVRPIARPFGARYLTPGRLAQTGRRSDAWCDVGVATLIAVGSYLAVVTTKTNDYIARCEQLRYSTRTARRPSRPRFTAAYLKAVFLLTSDAILLSSRAQP